MLEQARRKISTIIQEEPVKLSQYIQNRGNISSLFYYKGTDFKKQIKWIEDMRLNRYYWH